MTSKERILCALRGGDVDYVPFIISWNENQRLHERLSWRSERERLLFASDMGWDTFARIGSPVTPAKEVTVRREIVDSGGKKVAVQVWETPAAVLREELNFTDDWDRSELGGEYIWLASDFRTTRYVEFPFKSEGDLDALEYIFPIDNPFDMEQMAESYKRQRKIADEFDYPLFAQYDAGMDWLFWLYPLEEAVYRIIDNPAHIGRILDQINGAKLRRLELLLALGVDGVIRRGWYECTDIWNPGILRERAWPTIKREIDMTHAAGKPYIYLIDTGAKAIAGDLAAMDIDCIHGLDPVQGDMTVKDAHAAFPGKTLWGGLSGPKHFGADSADAARCAVEEAISVYGRKRLILGMAASYRYYYPWENYLAAESAWRRLR